MKKSAAQELVRSTLQSPFDQDRFYRLVRELVNSFDDTRLLYRSHSMPDAYSARVSTLERIGTYEDPEGNKIDLLIVKLKKAVSLERARTMQRNLIAWYLGGSRRDGLRDAALVAFVSPGEADWRFSLVKMEYKITETAKGTVKAKQEFTPAKRYSFLVGENETSHTAQSRLVPIIEDDAHNPTVAHLEDAFNIEKVTRDFFEKYRALYLWVKETLDEVVAKNKAIKRDFEQKRVDTVDFSKKLLGQIVFLYFLQKKGWFGVKRGQDWGSGSRHFLRELFDKEHGEYENFFNDVLEPLFYEALRLERPGDYYSRFDCRIPFLNGGLFDPINDYDWVDTDIVLPNELFSNHYKTDAGDIGTGILDVFDRYNFTVKEDEPLEKEVAVDPEMLGKVFENLLEVKDRKSKGTYYTPREIVHFMCQESLADYLATELKGKVDKADIETLIRYGETAIENDIQVKKNGGETKDYAYMLAASIRKNAKLIDEHLAAIRVCDPAVGSGAFPVGMMSEIVRTRNALSPYIQKSNDRTVYAFKRHAIQNSLYGVDIDPGAVEIAKLRLWLSLVVDEEDIKRIKPLPNLDYKVVQGNSLLSVEKGSLFISHWMEELEKTKLQLFNETNPRKKLEYQKQIDELIRQITNGHTDFDFEVYFSEVFREKGGFDVVIANPPYVKEYVNRTAFDGIRGSPYYKGKMDLWYMFACIGLDIARDGNGLLTFIAQNNWVTSYGASKMRNKVVKDAQILSLIDFGNLKIFEAGIQTMIMIFRSNTEADTYSFDYRRLRGRDLDLEDALSLLNKEANNKAQYLTPTITREDFLDRPLTFSSADVESILKKISSKGNFRLDAKREVAQGIVCPQDSVNKSSQEVLGANVSVGSGIFILSNAELEDLRLSRKELSLIKPLYTTSELDRWWGDSVNRKWIIYTDSSFRKKKAIEEYPRIKKHLDQFRRVITSSNKPYGLHRARDESFFKGEKIVSLRKCKRPTFTYVDFDSYVTATFYVIKVKRMDQKYLTGILNSNLVAFWLKHRGKMQGTNYQIDKEPLVNIPILKPGQAAQEKAAAIVTKIISVLGSKQSDEVKQAKVGDYEKRLNELVYELYGLSPEEVEIIERQSRN